MSYSALQQLYILSSVPPKIDRDIAKRVGDEREDVDAFERIDLGRLRSALGLISAHTQFAIMRILTPIHVNPRHIE